MIVVLGGGVTGLAAARTLRSAGREFLLLEKEAEPGGHCRSLRAGPYTFDLSGHFLHTADPSMRAWIRALPGVHWADVERDARVFLRGTLTPYPFQLNLKGHDSAFIARCLDGFARERIRAALGAGSAPANFKEWLRTTFGGEMCRAFFFPYNRKMWRVPLEEMSSEWTDWSVPVPRFDELLTGARGEVARGSGYNAKFLYPREGGIGALVRALAAPVRSRVGTRAEVVHLDLAGRSVRTADGKTIPYAALVSTIPLPALSGLSEGLSARAREAAASLRWVKVLSVNFGVRGPRSTPGHWTYVPERAYSFFRVGILSNVAPSSAPPGCASLFAERSFPADVRIDIAREVGAAADGLARMGILGRGSRIEETRPVLLDPGYVIFDEARRKAVPLLVREFARRGVVTAGRYGAWDYYGMERSMADGIRAARDAMRIAERRTA